MSDSVHVYCLLRDNSAGNFFGGQPSPATMPQKADVNDSAPLEDNFDFRIKNIYIAISGISSIQYVMDINIHE